MPVTPDTGALNPFSRLRTPTHMRQTHIKLNRNTNEVVGMETLREMGCEGKDGWELCFRHGMVGPKAPGEEERLVGNWGPGKRDRSGGSKAQEKLRRET